MGRNIGAGLAGVVVAGLIVWLIEMLSHAIYPMPEGLEMTDIEAMTDYIESLPIGAFVWVVVAWIGGTLGGTIVGIRIGTAPAYIFAMLVGAFMLIAITINLVAFPHPTWVAVSGVIGAIAAAWAGMKIGGKPAATR